MSTESLPMTAYSAHVDGIPGSVGIGPHGLDAAGRMLPWVEMDGVTVRGHAVHITMYDAPPLALTMLGPRLDAFSAELLEARSRARRAALLQWTGTPEIAAFVQAPASPADGPVGVHVFADGFTVEPRTGVPELVPYALVTDVTRDGYRITFQRRGCPEVTVSRLGPRTDEFLAVIDRCRSDENAAMATAFANLDDRLSGLAAPNGWAIAPEQAGAFGGALVDAFAAGPRADEMTHHAGLSRGKMRYGISLRQDGPMPYALATGRATTAVESADAGEARATYVFSTTDTEALNRALIMLSFRREAIHLPVAELGRWSLAVRTLPMVEWARSMFVARVIHDDTWAEKVTAALR
jgi:hypothetical protein